MPRDGSGQYSQPFPNVVEGTEIESAVYNGYTADVTIDLNTPRPIIAGGTGANNAHDAMVNLKGEIAKQGPVTNYDSFPFEAGSFYSNAGATAAPTANAFAGICYQIDNGNFFIEGRDAVDGKRWGRGKIAGVWGAWASEEGTYDARFVNVGGDTMTGSLRIEPASGPANLILNKAAAGTDSEIWGQKGGLGRWLFRMGNAVAETGGNAGSDFDMFRFNDDGTAISNVFSIARASGQGTFRGNWIVTGDIRSSLSATAGVLRFGDGTDKYLYHDGVNGFTLGGGRLTVNGGVYSTESATGGTFHFGNSGTKYLSYNGGNFDFVGGPLYVNPPIGGGPATIMARGNDYGTIGVHNGSYGYIFQIREDERLYIASAGGGGEISGVLGTCGTSGDWTFTGHVASSIHGTLWGSADFTAPLPKAGGSMTGKITCAPTSGMITPISSQALEVQSAGASSEAFMTFHRPAAFAVNFGLSPSNNDFYMGGFSLNTTAYKFWTTKDFASVPSDYRIKKDVIDLPGMWDTVKALRPIKYTHQDFTPPGLIESRQQARDTTEYEPTIKADDIERWGFLAHELQETLIEDAAHAPKDDPNLIQAPNPFTVIAALTKALQEAMARIEALEATR